MRRDRRGRVREGIFGSLSRSEIPAKRLILGVEATTRIELVYTVLQTVA